VFYYLCAYFSNEGLSHRQMIENSTFNRPLMLLSIGKDYKQFDVKCFAGNLNPNHLAFNSDVITIIIRHLF
jgi:hypothetical protein